MSCKYLLFLSFASLIACVFAQYQYSSYSYRTRTNPGQGSVRTYPINRTYSTAEATRISSNSNSNEGYIGTYPYPSGEYPGYQIPCQTSCGTSCRQPCGSRCQSSCGTSCQSCGYTQRNPYCRYFPCYSQNQYYQPYYSNGQYINPYGYPGYPGGQYANGYLYSNRRSLPGDPYANTPVDVVDGDDISKQRVNPEDQYANVPVEIIDEDDYINFWKNAPKLPTRVKQSAQSEASASQGTITSDSITQSQSKPVTITRSVPTQLFRKNPIVNLDFVNGEAVTDKEGEIEDKKHETTTAPVSTTEESEDVSPVKSWF